MTDTEFLEWWDGCAWQKTSKELHEWPRKKLREMQDLNEFYQDEAVKLRRMTDERDAAVRVLNQHQPELCDEIRLQRDHEAERAKAAIRMMTKLDRERATAERKLATCLRALDLLRRDSKSPDFVKVYCAVIEDELASLGGGGAERHGEETCEQRRAASPSAKLSDRD